MVSNNGPAKVTWKATDGTADHGLDYVGHAGHVFFANGQSEGFIKIKIVDDKISESPETFKVTLVGAISPSTVDDPKTIVITIKDDDKPCHDQCGTNAVCNEAKHLCFCEKGFLGDPYKECHRPCYGKCLSNAKCNVNLNACECNKGLVGDGVNKCAPPCDGKCKDYKFSHCNFKTNKCECNPNYFGDPYTSGCKCSTSHY
ncbi:slit homolog 1 protein-like [Argopecten irradians]|uniref:slit homolog 1 protein-like n=1 Tax=Argopecten irradians TaxID=31199 RepID=UPI00371110A1